MAELEKVIKAIETHFSTDDSIGCDDCTYENDGWCMTRVMADALELLKEQEAEIRQLRLALDIAKGTCKGIKSGGGQFADMPTMQSAT